MSDAIIARFETALSSIDVAKKEIKAAAKLRSKECNQKQTPLRKKSPKLRTRRAAAKKLKRGPLPGQLTFDFSDDLMDTRQSENASR